MVIIMRILVEGLPLKLRKLCHLLQLGLLWLPHNNIAVSCCCIRHISNSQLSFGSVAGESEDSEDFCSPLESLSQVTSYRELLRIKECETSMPEVDCAITPVKSHQSTLDDSYIQLTSHAATFKPVQSDMTNKIIFSANTPSNYDQSATWTSKHSVLSSPVHDSQYSFSSPMELNRAPEKLIPSSSLYVFSPPLTRSATRK